MNRKILFFARIKEIEFLNFRNIEKGKIELPNSNFTSFLDEEPSILGLYGQNGSGKTSVIMALGLLKKVLSGEKVSCDYVSCIKKGADHCSLSFTFSLYGKLIDSSGESIISPDMTSCYEVYYSFDINDVQDVNENDFETYEESGKRKLIIDNEIIKIRVTTKDESEVILPKQSFFDSRKEISDYKGRSFGPKQKYDFYISGNKTLESEFREIKAISKAESRSFFFSKMFVEKLSEIVKKRSDESQELIEKYDDLSIKLSTGEIEVNESSVDQLNEQDIAELQEYITILHYIVIPYYILNSLNLFGRGYLHVIDTVTTGTTNINKQLPFFIWRLNSLNGKTINTLVRINMDGPTKLSEKLYPTVCESIHAVSEVLSKIVPGLTLDIHDLGKELDSTQGNDIHSFELVSNREGSIIPIKYESDGIRRIVSILNLLIAAYNDRSFTIAIDEIDSGIYEYLLGEILTVMADNIKGQLVFTSHNLRPLEVLPAKYLCFTTTDKNNRFTSLSQRGNSNLRDTYFRNIILGNDKFQVYQHTDRYKIELAFYKAGHSEVEG